MTAAERRGVRRGMGRVEPCQVGRLAGASAPPVRDARELAHHIVLIAERHEGGPCPAPVPLNNGVHPLMGHGIGGRPHLNGAVAVPIGKRGELGLPGDSGTEPKKEFREATPAATPVWSGMELSRIIL